MVTIFYKESTLPLKGHHPSTEDVLEHTHTKIMNMIMNKSKWALNPLDYNVFNRIIDQEFLLNFIPAWSMQI